DVSQTRPAVHLGQRLDDVRPDQLEAGHEGVGVVASERLHGPMCDLLVEQVIHQSLSRSPVWVSKTCTWCGSVVTCRTSPLKILCRALTRTMTSWVAPPPRSAVP